MLIYETLYLSSSSMQKDVVNMLIHDHSYLRLKMEILWHINYVHFDLSYTVSMNFALKREQPQQQTPVSGGDGDAPSPLPPPPKSPRPEPARAFLKPLNAAQVKFVSL